MKSRSVLCMDLRGSGFPPNTVTTSEMDIVLMQRSTKFPTTVGGTRGG